jgi:hypothetical protein
MRVFAGEPTVDDAFGEFGGPRVALSPDTCALAFPKGARPCPPTRGLAPSIRALCGRRDLSPGPRECIARCRGFSFFMDGVAVGAGERIPVPKVYLRHMMAE